MYVRGRGGGGLSQKNFFGPSDLTLVLNKGGDGPPGSASDVDRDK